MPLEQAAPLRFDVTMEQSAAGHRARIEVAPRGLRRELTAANCEELADAISIAVALALGSSAGAPPESAVRDADEPEALPPLQGSNQEQTATTGAVGARTGDDLGRATSVDGGAAFPELSLSLWLIADAGSLPAPAVGTGLGAEASWRRFELHVLATLLFDRETEVDSTAPARPGAKLGLWTGSALGCTLPWGVARTAPTPFVCLGLEVGRLSGEGMGVSDRRRGSAVWVAPVVQLGGAWAIPDSALRLEAALLGAAPLNRDEFTLRGIGSVHQPSAWIGRLSVGVGFDF